MVKAIENLWKVCYGGNKKAFSGRTLSTVEDKKKMHYRELGKTGFLVSEVGIGGEYLEYETAETVRDTMHAAMDSGVNILDVFMPEPNIRTNLGSAIKGRREKIYIQGHICSVFENGQYGRTRDLQKSKQYLEDLLVRLQTDYIDIGMLHYIDTEEEWKKAQENGIIDRMLKMKEEGRFRVLGVSSHDSVVAQKLVLSGIFDVLMFGINPMFDFAMSHEDVRRFLNGLAPEKGEHILIDKNRAELYRLCEQKGVGITAMKSLGAGRLLHAAGSPFGIPLSVTQCIHYALTRPGVASALVGAKSVEEIEEAVGYAEATSEEKDYTALFAKIGRDSAGTCMYCNHCLPCPAEIDVASVTRLLDEAGQGNRVAAFKKYRDLQVRASSCISCGACLKRCPFGVNVIENMKRASAIFEAEF
ncbi:MAG: aldo/keto reductase [Christensenella sp.]|nr:aldo/keto reductase [Christensenella sp.]